MTAAAPGVAPSAEASGERAPTRPLPHTALIALCAIARLHGIAAEPALVSHQLGCTPSDEFDDDKLLLAARHLGLKAKIVATGVDRFQHMSLPAMALVRPVAAPGAEGQAGDVLSSRWIVLGKCDGHRVIGQDVEPGPTAIEGGRPFTASVDDFSRVFLGRVLLMASRASLNGSMARFDFTWFIPAIVKYRKLIGEVFMISLFLQLIGLISPLFSQVVMDKVLVHHALTTLDVLVIGLVAVTILESALSGLRAYIFSHTTNRIDVELSARLFRHLVQLPLAYFQARRVGDSVARVRELENIRGFLTGNAMTVVLDVIFSIVFIAVMLFYSAPLTLIVLISMPLYVAVSLLVVPVLRVRLDEKFARGAENQSMLVETVTAIQTVKAGALEPSMGARWDKQMAAYVSASFRVQNLATWAHEAVGLIGKLVNAATLWYGAQLVMGGQMTVGQFVAFNMFAQRVAQPIMRMAQLWTDFQQVGISMARLGDVLNTRTEVTPHAGAHLPRLQGRIEFDAVSFRYRPEASPVLQGVSIRIQPGEVLGVVGRSGSGKSTLTKLAQRLYVPEFGRVLVDGVDISLIDAAQLRRQIGVVLQENILFNRSVRENIAISDPAAPIDDVVAAAKLAGAHEFIADLTEGYDTVVGEQGSGLSGGQRQRVAIARALFTQPRILIFDEATSALDYESEAIIQRNMASICKGRTVLIIAHRLSAVRHADRIIVMERGRIIESGSHDELLRMDEGAYARLWRLQETGQIETPAGESDA